MLILSKSINKHGHHRQFLFLIGQFFKIFSETACPNEPKLGRKHLWKVLYKITSKQNERWATQAQSTKPLVYFFLSEIQDGLHGKISFWHWAIWENEKKNCLSEARNLIESRLYTNNNWMLQCKILYNFVWIVQF